MFDVSAGSLHAAGSPPAAREACVQKAHDAPLHIDHGKHQSVPKSIVVTAACLAWRNETSLLSDVRRDACSYEMSRGDPKTAARIRCETRAASSRSTCSPLVGARPRCRVRATRSRLRRVAQRVWEGETHLGCQPELLRTKGPSRTTTRQVRSRGRRRSADPSLPRLRVALVANVSSIVMPRRSASIVTASTNDSPCVSFDKPDRVTRFFAPKTMGETLHRVDVEAWRFSLWERAAAFHVLPLRTRRTDPLTRATMSVRERTSSMMSCRIMSSWSLNLCTRTAKARGSTRPRQLARSDISARP